MRIAAAVAVVMIMAAPATAERYAHHVAVADSVAIGATIGGQRENSAFVRGIGMGTGIVGAPLVHLANGNSRGAVKSLALRVTLPIALAWAARRVEPGTLCTCDPEDHKTIRNSHVAGFVVGLVVASVVDATAFAKQPSERQWAPELAITQGGARVGFAMTF